MKYDYVLQISEPGDEQPRWSIAFSRNGHYQLFNLENKPINGKIMRGHSEHIVLEEEKVLSPEEQMRVGAQKDLRMAVRRALYQR